MSMRGRGGGSKVLTKRPNRQRKKKMCEDGAGCKFKHEYQHQLEFTHDKASATFRSKSHPSAGGSIRRSGAIGGAGNTGSTISALNGTGPRGRKVAVAADRRRTERSLRQGIEESLVEMHGGDEREAHRTRWVMRMQQEMEQPPGLREPRAASSRRGGRGGSTSHGRANRSETRGVVSARPSSVDRIEDEVEDEAEDELLIEVSPPRVSSSLSSSSSPSSPLGRRYVSRNAGRASIGGNASSSVGRKRAAAGISNVQGEVRTASQRGRKQGQGVEIICID